MRKLLNWLRDEPNREAIQLLGTALVIVVGGGFALLKYFRPPVIYDPAYPPQQERKSACRPGKYYHDDGTILTVVPSGMDFLLYPTKSDAADYSYVKMECVNGELQGSLDGRQIFLQQKGSNLDSFIYGPQQGNYASYCFQSVQNC